MTTIAIVHHRVSPQLEVAVAAMTEALAESGWEETAAEVELVSLPALATTPTHILGADGYVWVTPANFGYMSGALKHMFDTCFYPCLGAVAGRPYGLWVHGNDDIAGARDSVDRLSRAWGLKSVGPAVESVGGPQQVETAACRELVQLVTLAARGELPR